MTDLTKARALVAAMDATITIGRSRCFNYSDKDSGEWFRELTVRGMTFLAPLDRQDEARHILAALSQPAAPNEDERITLASVDREMARRAKQAEPAEWREDGPWNEGYYEREEFRRIPTQPAGNGLTGSEREALERAELKWGSPYPEDIATVCAALRRLATQAPPAAGAVDDGARFESWQGALIEAQEILNAATDRRIVNRAARLVDYLERNRQSLATTPPQPVSQEVVEACTWRPQEDGYNCYSTGCGHEFMVNDGPPEWPFCNFCARPLLAACPKCDTPHDTDEAIADCRRLAKFLAKEKP